MTTAVPKTIGDFAKSAGVPAWKLRRLITRKLIPEPARVGVGRVFFEHELPAIKAALIAAGYLAADTTEITTDNAKP